MTVAATPAGAVTERLVADGYALAERAVSPDLLATLQDAVDAARQSDVANGLVWRSNGNQRVFNLLHYDPVFLDLCEHPAIIEPVRAILGEHALLSSIVANIAEPGNKAQSLHADQGHVAEPWSAALTVNAVVMLDDFTEENGATRVIPRSHLCGVSPSSDDLPTVPITGNAGDIAFLDGRVWHGSGLNRGPDSIRRGILVYFSVPYLRQQENFTRSLPRWFIQSLTSSQRALLGFDVWSGVGQVNGLPREWQGTHPSRTGPINNDGLFTVTTSRPE